MERNDVVMILTDIAQSNFGEMDIKNCDGDLIEAGFDSMNIINYILMIEERFGFEFDDDDLVLDNFRINRKNSGLCVIKGRAVNDMNNILYCIIRSERILYEALCSIRSLAMIYGKQFDLLTVTVVTDLPLYMFDSVSCFPNVRIDVISEETSHDWLFQCKANMFRVKILALMYYLDKYKSDVLFVDSDTVFVDRPEYIFDYMAHGQFVMNFKCMSLKEVVDRFYGIESDLIKNEDSRKRVIFYRKLYERRRIDSLFSSKTYEIPETFVPYNSWADRIEI